MMKTRLRKYDVADIFASSDLASDTCCRDFLWFTGSLATGPLTLSLDPTVYLRKSIEALSPKDVDVQFSFSNVYGCLTGGFCGSIE